MDVGAVNATPNGVNSDSDGTLAHGEGDIARTSTEWRQHSPRQVCAPTVLFPERAKVESLLVNQGVQRAPKRLELD